MSTLMVILIEEDVNLKYIHDQPDWRKRKVNVSWGPRVTTITSHPEVVIEAGRCNICGSGRLYAMNVAVRG